jgi:hypothetical protein
MQVCLNGGKAGSSIYARGMHQKPQDEEKHGEGLGYNKRRAVEGMK